MSEIYPIHLSIRSNITVLHLSGQTSLIDVLLILVDPALDIYIIQGFIWLLLRNGFAQCTWFLQRGKYLEARINDSRGIRTFCLAGKMGKSTFYINTKTFRNQTGKKYILLVSLCHLKIALEPSYRCRLYLTFQFSRGFSGK